MISIEEFALLCNLISSQHKVLASTLSAPHYGGALFLTSWRNFGENDAIFGKKLRDFAFFLCTFAEFTLLYKKKVKYCENLRFDLLKFLRNVG